MKEIRIVIQDDNYFNVFDGDKHADGLTWDEMLGQIASMTHPSINEPRYGMRTQAQWDALNEHLKHRREIREINRFAEPHNLLLESKGE